MATVTITVNNDADFYRVFQYASTADPPVPIDITGCTMEMMLRRRAEDETAVVRLSTDTGEIVITDPAAGTFSVFISHMTLQQIGLGEYAHSNIMTMAGRKTEIWSGTLTNNAGPTR